MTYAKYLVNKNELMNTYSARWADGGTYGTCWDENGPSDCSHDTPTDQFTFYEYDYVLEKFFDEVNDIIRERYKNCLIEDEESETDYYGGCAEYGILYFNTEGLIRDILEDLYGYKNMSIDEAKYELPELFL